MAIADMTINDGQATPVSHNFEVARVGSDFVQFEDRVNGVYVGYNRLTLQMVRPKGASSDGNRNLKLLLKVETPILEEVSAGGSSPQGYTPAPKVAYRLVSECKFTVPERASLAELADLFAFTSLGMNNESQVNGFLRDLNFPL